jgi:hypothetical protein
MLVRAAQLSLTVPYSWTFIDKPVGAYTRTWSLLTYPISWQYCSLAITEGQVVLIFLPNPAQFPNDGIQYQDQETRYALPAPGGRVRVIYSQDIKPGELISNAFQEIEVMEVKYGFVPNSQEATAWRVRRRYRLLKGGHHQIALVHYTRGPAIRESVFVSPPIVRCNATEISFTFLTPSFMRICKFHAGLFYYYVLGAAPSISTYPPGDLLSTD